MLCLVEYPNPLEQFGQMSTCKEGTATIFIKYTDFVSTLESYIPKIGKLETYITIIPLFLMLAMLKN
jgi:hypothetical protein